MAKVVLVDEDLTVVQVVAELIRSEGHHVLPFTNGRTAFDAVGTVGPELIVANIGSERSRATALQLLERARSLPRPAAVLAVTASGALEIATEVLKRGAYDYIARPFTLDEMKLRIQRALLYQSTLAENVFLRHQVQSQFQLRSIVGTSPRMSELLKLVESLAEADGPVLILGPAGSGKELVARAIHFNSRRRFAPFLAVSCAAPEAAVEAALFGLPKGTPSTPHEARPSAFQEAAGGTIVLKELGALPSSLQGRLLRVLQERQIRSLGQENPTVIDVRVLAASKDALEQKVAAGAFRQDLFEAFNGTCLTLPALCQRLEDIPLLAAHFLDGKMHNRSGRPFAVTREALDVCAAYEWPGNVRELEQALQRACAVCEDGSVRVQDLPAAVQRLVVPAPQLAAAPNQNGRSHLLACAAESRTATGERPNGAIPGRFELAGSPLVPLKKFLRDQELNYLHQTLEHVGGSKERAAELLGISLATIYRKLTEPDEV